MCAGRAGTSGGRRRRTCARMERVRQVVGRAGVGLADGWVREKSQYRWRSGGRMGAERVDELVRERSEYRWMSSERQVEGLARVRGRPIDA